MCALQLHVHPFLGLTHCWTLSHEPRKPEANTQIYFHGSFQKSVPNAKIGFSKAIQAGWIQMDKKAEGGPRVFRKVSVLFQL